MNENQTQGVTGFDPTTGQPIYGNGSAGQQQTNQFQGQPYGNQNQPNAYQGQFNSYQTQSDNNQTQFNGYQTQSGNNQTQFNGYQTQAGNNQAQFSGYQTQAGNYQGQSYGYQAQPNNYQGQQNGFQNQQGGVYQMNYSTAPNGQMPRKKHGGAVIAVLVAVVLVVMLAVGGVFAYKNFGTITGDDLQAAFDKTFTLSENDPLSSIASYKTLERKAMLNGGKYTADLKIDEVSGEDLGSPEVNMIMKYDPSNGVIDINGGITTGGITVDNLGIYIDSDFMVFNAPVLYNKALYLDYSGDYETRIRESAWGEMMSYYSSSSLDDMIESIDAIKMGFEQMKSVEDYTPEDDVNSPFSGISERFFDEIDLKKIDSEKLTLDGKEVTCKGYRIALDKEQVTSYAEELIDVLAQYEELYYNGCSEIMNLQDIDDAELEEIHALMEELKEEVKSLAALDIDVYLYDGQIAKADCTFTDDEDETFVINYTSTGGEVLGENMELQIGVPDEDDYIYISRSTCYEEDSYTTKFAMSVDYSTVSFEIDYDYESKGFELTFDIDEDLQILVSGVIDEYVDGESLSMAFDNISFVEYGMTELAMSGRICIGALDEQISKPNWDTVDLFSMSEYELYDFAIDIYDSTSMFMGY